MKTDLIIKTGACFLFKITQKWIKQQKFDTNNYVTQNFIRKCIEYTYLRRMSCQTKTDSLQREREWDIRMIFSLKRASDSCLQNIWRWTLGQHLIQVVWRTVQQEMIKSWTRYEELVFLNYKEELMFSNTELINCFSEITKYRIK